MRFGGVAWPETGGADGFWFSPVLEGPNEDY